MDSMDSNGILFSLLEGETDSISRFSWNSEIHPPILFDRLWFYGLPICVTHFMCQSNPRDQFGAWDGAVLGSKSSDIQNKKLKKLKKFIVFIFIHIFIINWLIVDSADIEKCAPCIRIEYISQRGMWITLPVWPTSCTQCGLVSYLSPVQNNQKLFIRKIWNIISETFLINFMIQQSRKI